MIYGQPDRKKETSGSYHKNWSKVFDAPQKA